MPPNEIIAQKRLESQQASDTQAAEQRSAAVTMQSAQLVAQTVAREADTSRRSTQPVVVTNDNLAQRGDIHELSGHLASLVVETTAKHQAWDGVVTTLQSTLLSTIEAVGQLDEHIGTKNAAIFLESVSELKKALDDVSALRVSADNEIKSGLQAVVEAISSLDMSPVVTVAAPEVTVEAPSMSPLTSQITKVRQAIEGITIPAPVQTDLSEVEKLQAKANEILERIAKAKHNVNVIGGGTQQIQGRTTDGNNVYLTAVESATTPGVYGLVVLNADGSALSTGGGTTTSDTYGPAIYGTSAYS